MVVEISSHNLSYLVFTIVSKETSGLTAPGGHQRGESRMCGGQAAKINAERDQGGRNRKRKRNQKGEANKEASKQAKRKE